MNLQHSTWARSALLSVALTALGIGNATAAPIQFGSNYYDLIIVLNPAGFADGSANTWAAASAAASASVFGGVNGHLATVTSAAENTFLMSLAAPLGYTAFRGAWLGGTGSAPWRWLVGPEAGANMVYTNWGGIEPNNAGLVYMNIGGFFAGIALGNWADDSGTPGLPEFQSDPVIGYFVEYENPDVSAVPEPSALVLVATGLAIAGRRFRRRPRTA